MTRLVRRISQIGAVAALTLAHTPVAAQEAPVGLRDVSGIEVDQSKLREAVASRTLTWLTGSSSNNDYISVGRLANFFGFVALRVSSNQSLTRNQVAYDTMSVLSKTQMDVLVALVEKQKAPGDLVRNARHDMNRALEGMLVGEPLSRDTFLSLGRAYGAAEAELGRVIAQDIGGITQTLSAGQMADLQNIRALHISGRGDEVESARLRIRLPQEDKQELVNLAARLLSWTTGTEKDNDFEVVGKPSQHFGFVSLRIASNHGVRRGDVAREVWSLLSPEQRQVLDQSATRNVQDFGSFLHARSKLMRVLESAQTGAILNPEEVKMLGAAIGEIEAAMTWDQAQAMITVRDGLTADQSAGLLAMRAKYTASDLAEGAAPADRGRQLFAQCALCHDQSDGSAIAPDLVGVLGREIASDQLFEDYSPALSSFGEAEGEWTPRLMAQFLAAPKSLVPGTTMGFDGFENPADREAVVDYLSQLE